MGQNNFKEIERINIANRKNSSLVKRNINSNIKLFSFVSDILEIYLPKAGSVFTYLLPDTTSQKDNKTK